MKSDYEKAIQKYFTACIILGVMLILLWNIAYFTMRSYIGAVISFFALLLIRMPDYGGVSTKGLKNIFSEELRDASAYYGDSEEDHEAIKKGIDFYYEDYPNAKPGINRTIP